MTVHGSWGSKLKSVKFEFDTQSAVFTGDDQSTRNVVFENPLPFDVPGLPRRCILDPPRAFCSCHCAPDLTDREACTVSLRPRSNRQSSVRPRGFGNITKANHERRAQGRLVGGGCDLREAESESKTDVAALISTAWAIVLSQQEDTPDIAFRLSLPERSIDSRLVRTSLDNRRPLSDILRDIATGLERLFSTTPRDDCLEKESRDASARSIVVLRESNVDLNESINQEPPLILDCIVDQDSQELVITALFDETRIQMRLVRFMLSDFEHLVWQMMQPQAAGLFLSDLETVGPVSQRAMRCLNRPLHAKLDCLLHDMISRHVLERPEAVAVDAWDGSLTYAELDEQSNQLAEHLVSLGVGPETFVPIIFEKSKLRIVATLAVIKAGGAFMPLDPNLPQLRLHTMVGEAEPPIAITSEACRGRMPKDVHEVVLSEKHLAQLPTFQRQGDCDPRSMVNPDNALYLMFTSGSTGKPKGVVISHSSFCSSASGFKDAIQLSSPNRRCLHFASSAFDASIMETLVTLLAGACICIPSDEDRLDNVAKCIVDFQVDWAFLTPTVARLLRPEDVPSLKTLCLGGEVLPKDVVEIWGDEVSVVNAYGPTECSIVAVVSDPIPRSVSTISLGKSRGCAVWIVNEEGNKIQSFNTVGEIVIEGPGVARGYLNDESKTAAVFGANARFLDAVTGSSSRFYKTGDLGRLNSNGTIDYLGRKDSQVKINGQRIEIGEIEHHVKSWVNRQDDAIDADVVVELLRPDDGSRSLLVAFVGYGNDANADQVAPRGAFLERSHPSSKEICERIKGMKSALLTKLPAYMIPSSVLPCDGIPRMTSGKTDRKALRLAGVALSAAHFKQLQLPVMDDGTRTSGRSCTTLANVAKKNVLEHSENMPDDGDSYPTSTDGAGTRSTSEISDASTNVEPDLTAEEQMMRGIWASVLQLPEDSILADDNFFMLGGDSVGLIKVVAACRLAGINTSVSALSSRTVLHEMATVCEPSKDSKNSGLPTSTVPFGILEPELVDSLREEVAAQCGVEYDLVEDVYPCTSMQEELMVANVMHSGVSVGRFIHRLPEDTDIDRFKVAWQSVYEDTPILRTRFANASSAGSLQAVIKEPIKWLESRNLISYIEADKSKTMLPGEALSRFALVLESEREIYFVWTMHHMLYDGWSVSLICKRMNAVYNKTAIDPSSDFRKFIMYSKGLDKGRVARYWEQKLKGVTPSVFPAAASIHTCRASTTFKDRLELPQTKDQCKATMSTMVQAAWAIMISHRTGTNDVLFGSTISGRNAPVEGIDNIEGPTLATVPVRLALSPESRAVDFLHLVRDHYIDLIPYEQTGLKTIRSIDEDAARACNFQNLLVVQSSSVWEDNVTPLGPPSHLGEDATVPLLCQVWLSPNAVDFDVVFDEEVACRDDVASAIDTVKEVLTKLFQLSDSSSALLAEIQPQTTTAPAEVYCKDLSSEFAVHQTIHGIIQDVSTQQNQSEALCATGFSMSYRELDDLSSRLALFLLNLGIQRGVILPLCFEKSVWTIVAILATLKTGSAFVLLDPSQPQQRLEELVSQVEATHVLMSPLQVESRSFGTSIDHVVLGIDMLDNLPAAKTGQLPDVSPDDLAYIIFTSGSTGRPKGVMISHTAFASSSTAYAQALDLESGRRVLQFSSYSFDASLNEILVVLMHGGVVCVATDTERVGDLAGFIRSQHVDWAILTPSVARLLTPGDVPNLETLDLGGEAPDQALLARWHRAGVRVFNVYGPAEGAGTSLSQRYHDNVDPRAIGKPMGCRVWVVDPDDHDNLLKGGDTGELLLEGPILASGYFKDLEKTGKSFVSDPKWVRFPAGHSAPRRMYKTGDLVFDNGDGVLIYVGRKDTAFAGQRIELGDIETNLATAIVAFEDKSRESFRQAQCARTELAARLPSSMMPAYWLEMTAFTGEGQSLPLSLSGKIDRRLITSRLEQLSSTEAARAFALLDQIDTQEAIGGAAITEYEQPAYTLAQKIHSLLPARARSDLALQRRDEEPGLEDLALHSSGLDSLNMMSLMYFISKEFQAKISMQLLMDKCTTIRKLADRIQEQGAAVSTINLNNARPAQKDTASVDVLAEINRHDSKIAEIEQRYRAQQNTSTRAARSSRPGSMTVLLTGGNGFIGTQILRQLLEHKLVKTVIALVRGATEETARSRTIEAGRRALWWTDLHGEKLQIWQGDLSLPHLGLSDTHWTQLSDGQIDVVIHNGAAVHWAKSYAALEAANINSSVELLGVAAKTSYMKFVYVTGGRDGNSPEDTDEDVATELSSADAVGYSQTKFVAEVLTKRAAQRCLQVCGAQRFSVISPGLVIGTPTEGVANVDDYIWRLAATCIRLGAYSVTQAATWIQVSDATTMAAAIVDAGLGSEAQEASAPVVRHVRDGMMWREFWAILRSMGYQLEAQDAKQWLAAARLDIETVREAHPLWPLAHMLESQMMQEDGPETMSQIGETPLRLKVAVRRNAEFLASVRWLPSPGDDARDFLKDNNAGGTFSRSGIKIGDLS